MTDPQNPPSESSMKDWIGEEGYRYWKRIAELIEEYYPGVFDPEWLFGGKKHGWSLRYKKTRSFCTLIPERKRCGMLIVFGAKEREKVEDIRGGLSQYTRKTYDDAKTYHDGKWVYFTIDSEDIVKDVLSLLALKRRPKKTENPHH
jgi:hypothetical protein